MYFIVYYNVRFKYFDILHVIIDLNIEVFEPYVLLN